MYHNILYPLIITKAMSNKQQVKVQVTGVLTHGHGSFVYLQYGQYSCDSNQTITVLVKCLQEISPLPEVVYIQMDNCSGQNKNKYVLAFLAHLVQSAIFRKVKLHAYYCCTQLSKNFVIHRLNSLSYLSGTPMRMLTKCFLGFQGNKCNCTLISTAY